MIVAAIIILLIAGKLFLNSVKKQTTPTQPQQEVVYEYTALELETMESINKYRESTGLSILKINNYISQVCEHHTNYMVNSNSVNHNDFVSRSEELISILGAKTVGENVAYNYSTAQAVVKSWLNSPTHKKNIEGDYTHFGISIRPNSSGKNYYTNIFIKKLVD